MKNTQVKAYLKSDKPKFHQLEFIKLLKERMPDFSGTLLDVGCASGTFIKLFSSAYPNSQCVGVDISRELIEAAKTNNPQSNFIVGDASSLDNCGSADIVYASGILSIFDEFEKALDLWISKTNPNGMLAIFGCFNSKNIDTKVYFRNNFQSSDWETGLTSYSVFTIENYLNSLGLKYQFIKFEMPSPLIEEEDPIRSFTKDTTDGERLILNGANIRTELYHLIVSL